MDRSGEGGRSGESGESGKSGENGESEVEGRVRELKKMAYQYQDFVA